MKFYEFEYVRPCMDEFSKDFKNTLEKNNVIKLNNIKNADIIDT